MTEKLFVCEDEVVQQRKSSYVGTYFYTTNQVCKMLGIAYSSIRHWVDEEILSPKGSKANGSGSRRYFTNENLAELLIIRALADFKFSTQDIKSVLDTLGKFDYFDRLSSSDRNQEIAAIGILRHATSESRHIEFWTAANFVEVMNQSVGRRGNSLIVSMGIINLVSIEAHVREVMGG